MEETRRLLKNRAYYGLPDYYYNDNDSAIHNSKSLTTEFQKEWIRRRIEESNNPQTLLNIRATESADAEEYKESNNMDKKSNMKRPSHQYYALDDSRRSHDGMTIDVNRASGSDPFSYMLSNIKNICIFLCCIIPLSIAFIVLLIHICF